MIRLDDSGPIWRLTIDRPDKAGALTGAMLAEMLRAVERAGREARGLILTGSGKVFSAGADLDEAAQGLATSPLWDRLSGAIAALPCPAVAALNGTVAGGALGPVLACDMRLAVPGARFFYPVMQLGYRPQPADPARLRALVGPARAAMLLMAAQKITADEALAWGLVDRLVPSELLLPEAEGLLEPAAAAAPDHAAAIKDMLRP